MPLEVLNLARSVLLGSGPRLECAQVAALAGFRIDLAITGGSRPKQVVLIIRILRCRTTLLPWQIAAVLTRRQAP